MLADKIAVASTLCQQCFNHETGACDPLRNLPPQLLYEQPIIMASSHTILLNPAYPVCLYQQ